VNIAATSEDVDPCAVRYRVRLDVGGFVEVAGFQIGRFIVRTRFDGEVGIARTFGRVTKGLFVVEHLPEGNDVADDTGLATPIAMPDEAARAFAWFAADELARHLIVDHRGFGACIRAWPGLRHLLSQVVAFSEGAPPVPWHHTLEYRATVPTLRPCDPDDVQRALYPSQEGEAA
jgi:hypothetical protein